MEVKIGVTDSPREIVFISAETPDALEKQVTAALGKGAEVVSLSDEKGRRFLIQGSRIAYVELGPPESGRVGFGIGAGPVTPPIVAD